MRNRRLWDWNNFKKHFALTMLLVIFIIVGLISEMRNAVEERQAERQWTKSVQAYKDAYLNHSHSHPHDPVSQTTLDPEVQQVQNNELSIE